LLQMALWQGGASGSEVPSASFHEHIYVQGLVRDQLLNRAFSASSSLTRLASPAFMPPQRERHLFHVASGIQCAQHSGEMAAAGEYSLARRACGLPAQRCAGGVS